MGLEESGFTLIMKVLKHITVAGGSKGVSQFSFRWAVSIFSAKEIDMFLFVVIIQFLVFAHHYCSWICFFRVYV